MANIIECPICDVKYDISLFKDGMKLECAECRKVVGMVIGGWFLPVLEGFKESNMHKKAPAKEVLYMKKETKASEDNAILPHMEKDTAPDEPMFSVKALFMPDGTVRLALKGGLNCYTNPRLKHVLNNMLYNRNYRLIIDMSGLDYATSGTAGIFSAAAAVAQENGGNIILVNPSLMVREIFDAFGIFAMISIVENIDAAIEILDKQTQEISWRGAGYL